MASRRRMGIAVAALAAAGLATGACGSASQEETLPARHLSATEHRSEAARHDREARKQERAVQVSDEDRAGGSQSYGCFDQPVPMPEPTSGGERIPVLRPCWTSETHPSSDRERSAAQHRRQAASHRSQAAALWRTERKACAGLGEDEISHSPFFHREDIARVEPLRSGDELIGARVVFRAVPGLSAIWMRKAIACHQARAAVLGYPARESSYDPLMVAPTTVTVDVAGKEIAVTVRAQREEEATAVLGRAQALLDR